jgi:hypothetical protein
MKKENTIKSALFIKVAQKGTGLDSFVHISATTPLSSSFQDSPIGEFSLSSCRIGFQWAASPLDLREANLYWEERSGWQARL